MLIHGLGKFIVIELPDNRRAIMKKLMEAKAAIK
jgi:hypothetical protein